MIYYIALDKSGMQVGGSLNILHDCGALPKPQRDELVREFKQLGYTDLVIETENGSLLYSDEYEVTV